MRRQNGIVALIDWIAPVMWWGCTILSALVVTASKMDAKGGSSWWELALNWFRSFSLSYKDLLLLGFAILMAIATSLIKKRGERRVDRVIKKLLNSFRGTAFPKGDGYDKHRVTLFQHRKWYFGRFFLGVFWNACFSRSNRWRWPWHGWLIPYERAGEYHLSSRTCFYAPKSHPAKAEGYAGMLWRTRLAQTTTALPVITKQSPSEERKKYAEASFINDKFINKRLEQGKPLPRSFWGTYIEVDGSCWGVIVVDSHTEDLPKHLGKEFLPTAICLAQLLSRKTS